MALEGKCPKIVSKYTEHIQRSPKSKRDLKYKLLGLQREREVIYNTRSNVSISCQRYQKKRLKESCLDRSLKKKPITGATMVTATTVPLGTGLQRATSPHQAPHCHPGELKANPVSSPRDQPSSKQTSKELLVEYSSTRLSQPLCPWSFRILETRMAQASFPSHVFCRLISAPSVHIYIGFIQQNNISVH